MSTLLKVSMLFAAIFLNVKQAQADCREQYQKGISKLSQDINSSDLNVWEKFVAVSRLDESKAALEMLNEIENGDGPRLQIFSREMGMAEKRRIGHSICKPKFESGRNDIVKLLKKLNSEDVFCQNRHFDSLEDIKNKIKAIQKKQFDQSKIKDNNELQIIFNEYQKEQQKKNKDLIRRLVEERDQIVGIEVIIAERSELSILGRWGHAMLRLVRANNQLNGMDDLVINFVADIDEPTLSYTKGLMGGYNSILQTELLGNYWNQYITKEERALHRLVIPTTSEMRQTLIDQILYLSEHPESIGKYTFMKNNCAGLLLKLLVQSNYPSRKKLAVVPVNVFNWLLESMAAPYPVLVVENPNRVRKQAQEALGLNKDMLFDLDCWPVDAVQRLTQAMSDLDILKMLNDDAFMLLSTEIQNELLQRYQISKKQVSLEQLMSFKNLPEEIYSTCSDAVCAQKNLMLEASLWSTEEIKLIRAKRKNIFREATLLDSEFQRNKSKFEQSVRHFQLLVENEGKVIGDKTL